MANNWLSIDTLEPQHIGCFIYCEPRNDKLAVGLAYVSVSGNYHDAEGSFKKIKPTHWMPLPDPPIHGQP